jgi:hypothetical protein
MQIQVIKRVRADEEAPPANPQTLTALQIPDKYKTYHRTENDPPENFLLVDTGVFQDGGRDHRYYFFFHLNLIIIYRILIFGRSKWWVDWSAQMREIYVDGTFRLAPPLFHQIYVILARRGDWIFPVAQCLLTGIFLLLLFLLLLK